MTLSVNYAILTKQIYLHLLGEWLNGRVAVSKTVGCVFESRLPCQCPVILKMTGHLRYYWIQPSHRNCFRTFFTCTVLFFRHRYCKPRSHAVQIQRNILTSAPCLWLVWFFNRIYLSAFSFFTGYFCTRENPG